MGRLALIVILIVAVVFGIRSFAGKDELSAAVDVASADAELISLISTGQEVNIADYVRTEGMVLVEFTADW